MGSCSFSKREKLCSQKTIDRLFKEGASVKAFPLRVVFLEVDEADSAVQVLISVPKKRIRKAHDRNRVKRLIREAYRLNKAELVERTASEGKRLALAFIYLFDRVMESAEVHEAMQRVLPLIGGQSGSDDRVSA
jgi:ribonuclease P protein component